MPNEDLLRLWTETEPIGPNGHHLVFESFERTSPYDDERYHYNFMGARIAHEFERDLIDVVPAFQQTVVAGLKASGRSVRYDTDPTFPCKNSEDYFEWIDLLTAIERSETQFVMVEVGAGYGRWIANAAAALKRRKKKPVPRPRLVGLEANQARYDLMVKNCEQVEIAPSGLRLLRAACTSDGSAVFMKRDDDYGTGVVANAEVMKAFDLAASDVLPAHDERGQRFLVEKVPGIRLSDLVTEPIDFIDFDIQGAELEVIPGSIDAMDRFVKLAHVATHSTLIDARLSHVFHLHGWRPRRIFCCGTVNQTPYGSFSFIDGIQSWENPRFD